MMNKDLTEKAIYALIGASMVVFTSKNILRGVIPAKADEGNFFNSELVNDLIDFGKLTVEEVGIEKSMKIAKEGWKDNMENVEDLLEADLKDKQKEK